MELADSNQPVPVNQAVLVGAMKGLTELPGVGPMLASALVAAIGGCPAFAKGTCAESDRSERGRDRTAGGAGDSLNAAISLFESGRIVLRGPGLSLTQTGS